MVRGLVGALGIGLLFSACPGTRIERPLPAATLVSGSAAGLKWHLVISREPRGDCRSIVTDDGRSRTCLPSGALSRVEIEADREVLHRRLDNTQFDCSFEIVFGSTSDRVARVRIEGIEPPVEVETRRAVGRDRRFFAVQMQRASEPVFTVALNSAGRRLGRVEVRTTFGGDC